MSLRVGIIILAYSGWVTCSPVSAQRGMYKGKITPHWSQDSSYFWYRNDLPDNEREFVFADLTTGQRSRAFDHNRLSQALRRAGEEQSEAKRLRLSDLRFSSDRDSLRFRLNGKDWKCDLRSYQLTRIGTRKGAQPRKNPALRVVDPPRISSANGRETELIFINQTEESITLFWLDGAGVAHDYGIVNPGEHRLQRTFAGHVWRALAGDGRVLAVFEATNQSNQAIVTGNDLPQYSGRRSRPNRREHLSPDGRWRYIVREHNLFVKKTDEDSREVQLSGDGSANNRYVTAQWAPDSQTLVAFRVTPAEPKRVYLIESSPKAGGRAILHSRPYRLPGDDCPTYELNLFRISERTQRKPKVDPIDFGRPRLRWNQDGHRFTYTKTDRGHQRFRLIEVDSHKATTRNIIDERSDTFIWTAHTIDLGIRRVTWLQSSDEIIYASEQDGWRHLYLIDSESGTSNQITKGEFVVRHVDQIDEVNRQIWFRASGMIAGQDPYLNHYYRINFDGTDMVALTEADGNHSLQFSPDRKHVIDSFSRVDQPPIHQLRRTSDGELVCHLEQADISELMANGWKPPQVFNAPGRDGKTEICGIICLPSNFDPARRYPIIESIYAGPQNSYVPKSFSTVRRFKNLTDAGFIVVQIDGMGTANRSKAFHDVCWKNLKDAGLADRICWHRAAAEKFPWYDISRVGIFGGSAGGQNSTAALLFHPDFYTVAVSACGCHDNRMDKASWNEQWMGYPVGPAYVESSNIENAHRLRGKLMLIVGELDTNVPPESTMRLADALIRADKDFDLVVIPGGRHGDGGKYGARRRREFFVRHLLGKTE